MDLWTNTKRKSNIALWPSSTGIQQGVDVRQELNDLIEGNGVSSPKGHWILLRRMELAQRCSCLLDSSGKYGKEADSNCNVCDGSGWVYDDELHMVRRVVVVSGQALSALEIQTDFGVLQVPFVMYYLQHYTHPHERDEIIEIETTSEGRPVRPFKRLEYFDINMAEPLRDHNGRIEYYRCGVKKKEL